MELLKISHLNKVNGLKPGISFSLAGQIRINHPAIELICKECYKSKETYYIHFYTQIKDNKLYIEINKQHEEGVMLRFDGGKMNRRNAKNISASGKKIIRYLAQIMDWPLAPDKLKVIRYQIGNEVKKGIYELV